MADTRTLESFVVERIKDAEVFQDVPGCPLSTEARRLLMATCPIYLIDPSEETANYLPYTTPTTVPGDLNEAMLFQPGPRHNRSFALAGQQYEEPWQDEHGNRYSSFTLKGINFTNPGIVEHPVSSDGVVAWGLQESKIIGRVLAASDVLTRRGVSTERIIGLAEPKTYPWPIIDGHTDAHEDLPLAVYKQRIVDSYWRGLPEAEQTIESLADLTKKFSDMTFLISLRATDTPFRLHDLDNADTRAKVFEHVNIHYLERKGPDSQPFAADGNNEYARYITDFFAPRAGKNLAKLHVDLAHGFANGLNWTAYGGIVDLDSVHGESLGMGDSPITNTDRAADLANSLDAIQNALPLGYLFNRKDSSKGVAEKAMERFLLSYFRETVEQLGDSKTTIEQLGGIIVRLGEVSDSSALQRELNGGKITTICDLYFDYFFRDKYPDAISKAKSTIIQQITEAIGTDERLAVKIVESIYREMDKYAGSIIEEYMAELADPTFDAVDQFVKDSERTTAYGELTQDITEGILNYFTDSDSLAANIPDCIKQIDDEEVRQLVIGIYIAELWDTLHKHAKIIATENISYIEPTLREAAAYERPEPLLPGHDSQPYVGLEYKRFILSTQGVSLDEIQAFVQSYEGELHIVQLPEPKKTGVIEFGVQIGDAVSEVISPDGIDSSTTDKVNGESILHMDFRAEHTDYVLFVSRYKDGKIRLGLMVKNIEAFKQGLGQVVQSNTPIQEQLFMGTGGL